MCFIHECISKKLNDSRPKRYSKDDACRESETTIEKVRFCPENIETFNIRSKKKSCIRYQTCAGQQLVYHCVRNGGSLVEVCAPRSLITGGYCPYYEKGLGRVIEDYRNQCKMCPFQYHSNNSSEYSECVFTPVINEDSDEQTSANANIETKIHPCSTNSGINIVGCEDFKKKDWDLATEVSRNRTEYETDKKDREKHDQTFTYVIISAVVLMCTCSVILFKYVRKSSTTFCFKHKHGLNHNNVKQGSLKSQCIYDPMYLDSNEAMVVESEYASFRHEL